MPNPHRIISRYVVDEYLKVFGLSLSSLILIYVVILFFQKMNLFVEYKTPFYLIFEYLIYKIPEVIFQWTLPYAILLSTLLTLGSFSRHNEIIALKAGGVSLYRITLPLFFIAFLISLFSFIGNEYLVPTSSQKTRYLLSVKVRREPLTIFFKNYKIWYRSDNRIFNIQLLDPREKILQGITLYEFDHQFRCIRRVDAKEARWRDGKWNFYHGALRNFDESGSVQMTPFEEMEFPIKEDWASF
ncbi:MAG: LptF/LptG family permease, partial [Thermodesulfobacteriota bacterium]